MPIPQSMVLHRWSVVPIPQRMAFAYTREHGSCAYTTIPPTCLHRRSCGEHALPFIYTLGDLWSHIGGHWIGVELDKTGRNKLGSS
mmetsp:Transcript_8316/g.13486  ORF Transcript_8316/g.13486 Transcript_8316/m.13486 type:complete len:86 (-) Transcript_8316:338-595(-)